jgi:hypothetical protein
VDDNEKREYRQLRQLKDCRRRCEFLELQLAAEIERRSDLEALLHEAISKRYFDEYKATPAWLAEVQAAFPPTSGARRDRPDLVA